MKKIRIQMDATATTQPASKPTAPTIDKGLQNLVNSLFSDKDMNTILVENEMNRLFAAFQNSENFKTAIKPEIAIDFGGAMEYICGETSANDEIVAKTRGDETGALAVMQFSHKLPLHLVHAALANLGHWTVDTMTMNPLNGNLVVGLSRKLHGFAIYVIEGFDPKTGHRRGVRNPITKTRWFLTEEEAVVLGDAAAKGLFDLYWAELAKHPMDWPYYECEDTEEFGFVHLNCLPNGDSIGIKLLKA